MALKEIDKELQLNRFLGSDEGRTAYSFIRGAVFHHLGEVLEYRKPVEVGQYDLAMQLLTISMIELAVTEFVSRKEREVEHLTEDTIKVV